MFQVVIQLNYIFFFNNARVTGTVVGTELNSFLYFCIDRFNLYLNGFNIYFLVFSKEEEENIFTLKNNKKLKV